MTIDLIISTFQFKKIGGIYSSQVTPFAANDPFYRGTGQLTSALEGELLRTSIEGSLTTGSLPSSKSIYITRTATFFYSKGRGEEAIDLLLTDNRGRRENLH